MPWRDGNHGPGEAFSFLPMVQDLAGQVHQLPPAVEISSQHLPGTAERARASAPAGDEGDMKGGESITFRNWCLLSSSLGAITMIISGTL